MEGIEQMYTYLLIHKESIHMYIYPFFTPPRSAIVRLQKQLIFKFICVGRWRFLESRPHPHSNPQFQSQSESD